MTDRRLNWPGCLNARDLGGLPTHDGRTTRTGALIRTDSLHYLTPEGVSTVNAAGVSRILDLRGAREIATDPTPFTGDPRTVAQWLESPDDPPTGATTIVEACTTMLDRRPERFAAALRAITGAPPGAVVVHCHGGKDRTGMVIALALAVAGVPEDEIVADYFLTQAALASRLEEQLAAEPDTTRHAAMIEFRDTRAESLVQILRHLDDHYRGPTEYLRQAGLTDADLNQLRTRLVSRPAEGDRSGEPS